MLNGPTSASVPLSLVLFGPFKASVRGEPLPHLRSRKGAWLLVLLALRPGCEVERDWLMALLWPESPEKQAAHSLRTSLTDLRRALGPEAMRLRSPTPRTLALDLQGAEVDLLTFDRAIRQGTSEALEAAVALYRGPLLEGCAEEWVFPERQQREQAYLEALETLAAQAQETGDRAGAERHLRRVIAVDPLRESAQRALMQTLAARGNYAAALLVYRELRQRLHREVNAEPDPETRELFVAIQAESQRKTPVTGQAGEAAPPAAVSHNLPYTLTRFIGREREIAAVADLFAPSAAEHAARLVTLTGAGGCGKSRLALEVARRQVDSMSGGSWLVELAALTDPALVPQTVAAALNVREEPGSPVETALMQSLRSRQLLLLLDNCEHLIEACARLSETLLTTCLQLRILATSRESLGLPGERLFRVPPLSLPPAGVKRSTAGLGRTSGAPGVMGTATASGRDPSTSLLLADLTDSEAVQLFLDRGAALLPTFRLTDSNAISVAAVCQRLDGIPLALELAAARLKLLPVDEIATRLGDRFRLLTRGSRTALPRHQTLRAAVDWSYDLLSPREQTLLRRLSVFAGGFTVAAAEAVCSDGACLGSPSPEVGGGGGQGAERPTGSSWPRQRAAAGAGPREGVGVGLAAILGNDDHASSSSSAIRNPQSLIPNEEVLDLLDELVDKSLVVVVEHHGEVRHRLLETLRAYGWERLTPEERSAVARRHAEYYLALAEATDPRQGAVDQAAGLERLETEHDNLRAALRWAHGPDGSTEAGLRLASALHWFWYLRHHLQEGHGWLEAFVEKSRSDQPALSPALRARALHDYGNAQSDLHDHAAARRSLEASLEIARNLGDRRLMAWALLSLGNSIQQDNGLTVVRPTYEESLAIFREQEDRLGMALSLARLGWVEYSSFGDYELARSLLEESLQISNEIGDMMTRPLTLEVLGRIARTSGDLEAAHGYYRQRLAISRALGTRSGTAASLLFLAESAHDRDDDTTAVALLQEGLLLHREVEDPWGVGTALSLWGDVECHRGNATRATALHREALAVWRQLRFEGGLVWSLSLLADLARREGDDVRAANYSREAWPIWHGWEECWRADLLRHLGPGWRSALLLRNLGLAAAAEGDLTAARELVAESMAHGGTAGDNGGALLCSQEPEAVAQTQVQSPRCDREIRSGTGRQKPAQRDRSRSRIQ